MEELVDWDLAVTTAVRLARPGPPVTPAQAQHVVALLRGAAEVAPAHVAAVTGLVAPPGPGAEVVERGAWARANAESFRELLSPVLSEALARRTARSRTGRQPRWALAVARRTTGLELGGVLALLSSRVLGQYDPMGGSGGAGRLLLVAPNVLSVQRELDVDLADFALWVTLHEEAHRLQFAAAPWLADHLRGRARAMAVDLLGEPGAATERLLTAARALPGVVRSATGSRNGSAADGPGGDGPGGDGPGGDGPGGDGPGGDGPGGASGFGLLELVATPGQRRALAEVTAVMSLLEGHADVAMDAVGPDVVPTVARIRARFSDRRRSPQSVPDRLLRQLLGLDAKLRQYADGARFVRGVTERVGTGGLNAVWSGPDSLPRPEEVADPAAWVRRVHG